MRERGDLILPADITPNARRIVIPELVAAIDREGLHLEGKEFSDQEIAKYQERIFRVQEEFDQQNRNPYHNAQHAREVAARVEQLLQRAQLPKWLADTLRFAAPGHDLGHAGTATRNEPDGLSHEEYSLTLLDPLAAEAGMSTYQRVMLYGQLIGTTFGNPNIQPGTDEERLLAIADIGGFIKPWDEWVKESANVLAEKPGERPRSIDEWIQTRSGFIGYIRSRMTPEADALWGTQLRELELTIEALQQNPTHPRRLSVKKYISPYLLR